MKRAEKIKMDLRPGGRYEIHMRTQSGTFIIQGEYLEVVRPEKLVFTWRSRVTHDKDTKVTVLLKDLGSATELLLIHEQFPDAESRDGNFKGWSATIGNLTDLNFKPINGGSQCPE